MTFCRFQHSVLLLSLLVVSLLAPIAGAVGGYGDVDDDQYFAEAVQWSVDKNITGIEGNCFLPEALVSRGEAAVYLHNMQQRPAAPAHGFVDIGDESQNAAVSWLYHNEITRGTSETTFEPDAKLTRAQLVTFLWRLADEPMAPAHSFVDVKASWQQRSVSWAADRGITRGTSETMFEPDAELTRAAIVTFLYRYQNEPEVTLNPSTPNCDPVNPNPTTTTTTTPTTTTTTTTTPPTTTTTTTTTLPTVFVFTPPPPPPPPPPPSTTTTTTTTTPTPTEVLVPAEDNTAQVAVTHDPQVCQSDEPPFVIRRGQTRPFKKTANHGDTNFNAVEEANFRITGLEQSETRKITAIQGSGFRFHYRSRIFALTISATAPVNVPEGTQFTVWWGDNTETQCRTVVVGPHHPSYTPGDAVPIFIL